MDEEQERLTRIVLDAHETLSIELKTWMDPKAEETKEKIIRGSFAIRNRNGGFIIFGINNKTRAIDPGGPADVRDVWIEDDIQALISRYASQPFEIKLRFVLREGIELPVIGIPSGVRTPVALKKPLGKQPEGAIFFRTLSSGGVVSTSVARAADWPEIIQICFDNRDADIGSFIRRHLADVDLASLGSLLAGGITPKPTLEAQTHELLDRGLAFFNEVNSQLPKLRSDPSLGAFEIAVRLDPPIEGKIADEVMRRTLRVAQPDLPGSFLWYEAPGLEKLPKQVGGRWINIVNYEGFWDYHDVMFVEPSGAFYQHRLLPTDAGADARGVKRGISIEPGFTVADVAEAIITGLAYARALSPDSGDTTLGFFFRWTGLSGRRLTDWSGELTIFSGEHKAEDSTVESFVEVPISMPQSAVVPIAEKAVRPLLAAFNGYVLKSVHAAKRIAGRLQRT